MKTSDNIKNFNNFCEVISFLDNNLWRYSNEVNSWDFIENLDETVPAHKNILLHWLVYLHDRAKRSKTLWKTAPPKINILLDIYFKDEIRSEKHIEELYNYENGIIYENFETKGKLKYITSDNKAVFKTLQILLNYDKNIIKYLKENYDNWEKLSKEYKFKCVPNNATKIAYLLYRLSFHKNEKILDKGFLWNKRIWAAIRDYIRWDNLNKIFSEGLNYLISPHRVKNWITYFNIDINDLELPGDMWNNMFAENFFVKFSNDFKSLILDGDLNLETLLKRHARKEIKLREIKTDDFSNSNYPYSKLIRIFYMKIILSLKKRDEFKSNFFPIQLDVSFDFASKNCNQKNEDFCKKICIFGNSGGKNLCIPGSSVCSVGFVSCGYISNCIREYEKNCPIFQMKGKNLCQKNKI